MRTISLEWQKRKSQPLFTTRARLINYYRNFCLQIITNVGKNACTFALYDKSQVAYKYESLNDSFKPYVTHPLKKLNTKIEKGVGRFNQQ